MHQLWKAKKYKVNSGKSLFWHFSMQLSFFRFLLIFFAREIKDFYQSSLRNEVDCRDIMNVSPNILAKKQKKRLIHCYVDERAMITTTLIFSCHCQAVVPFCLQKKRPENAFLTLTVNYHKIIQKNKLCHPKQQ